ncbi:universal stress protein [Geopsychrobacter electrodiphilus]|uniref:universal stress protein n=1 Tax=Geopsychrobacter electrodiphilus TaxID=225196 RepID=UPI00037FE74A|nr:universal stress protein [Geopsychrobacter electrodiphilus]
MKNLDTLLVAIDFSDSSDKAFNSALFMAKKFSARLILVHVINEPVDLRGFYVPHISFDKLEEEITAGAEKMMEHFCRNHLQNFKNYESLIVPGVPYQEIIKTAQDKNVDMIVLGTHGRTGLDHVLFGSTAEKVVRKSPLPVLTVRLDDV